MRRILLVGVIGLAACGDGGGDSRVQAPSTPPAGAPQAVAGSAAEMADADAMAKWARSCALCHVNGEGGAPRLGDQADWSTRLARGEATLLTHTIEGYNNMPPLGYCMDCDRGDFLELIRFMASGS